MSPRDLPVWGRAAAALVLLGSGWYLASQETLVSVAGDSILQIVAGLVAVSVLRSMRLPLALWPASPARDQFSVPLALIPAVVASVLILLAAGTGVPGQFLAQGRGAVPVLLIGIAAWSLAWGAARQEAFHRWFAMASVFGAVPVVVAAAVAKGAGQLPPLGIGTLGAAGFHLVIVSSGVLVTHEIAFRRLLVGQSGGAGVVTIAAAALAFGVWHLLVPVESGGWEPVVGGVLNGLVLGSLYVLSRSLLVAAWYQGVQVGLLGGLQYSAASTLGVPALGQTLWTTLMVGTGAVAVGLLVLVVRQNGWRGELVSGVMTPFEVGPDDNVLSGGEDAAGD